MLKLASYFANEPTRFHREWWGHQRASIRRLRAARGSRQGCGEAENQGYRNRETPECEDRERRLKLALWP